MAKNSMALLDMNILLVEDNPGDSRLICEMLKDYEFIKYSITVTEKLATALIILDDHMFDLIILDLNLPDSNGIESLDAVVAATTEISPIIILTGINDEILGYSAIEHGAKDFLVKGTINSTQLSRSIRYTIEKWKMDQSIRDSELLFRKLFKQHSAIKLLLDPETGNIIDANDAAVSFYGWSYEKLLSMRIQDINTLPIEEVKSAIETVRNQQRIRFEFRHRRADDSIRDVEVFSSKIEVKGKDLLHSIIHDITDRRQAEEALRESEERFRNLHESMIDAFVQVDMSGHVVSFNSTYREMLGYSEAELSQLTYQDLTPDKWHTYESDIVQKQILINGYSAVYEKEYRKKDGTIFPVELRTSLLTDKKGNPVGMWAIVRDITERKHMETALNESEERYRTFINATQDMAFLKDNQFRYVMINDRNAAFFGKKPEEIIGKNDFEMMPYNAAENCMKSDEQALAKNTVVINEEVVGGRIYETRKFPVHLRGMTIGVGGYIRDITEIKIANEKIIRSEEALRIAQKVAHVGSWAWYIQENRVEWSDEMFNIFGVDKNSFDGNLTDIIKKAINPDDWEAVENANRSVILYKKPIPVEYRIIHNNGDVRTVYAEAGELILDENNSPMLLSGIVEDISDRKRSEDEIKYINAILGNLINVIRDLAAARNRETVFATVRTSARRLMNADGASFVLRDGDMCHYIDEDAIHPLWKGQKFPIGECISGWVMTNGKPAIIEDINNDNRTPNELYSTTFIKSLVMVPIGRIEIFGAIGTYWAKKHIPSPKEMDILTTLADATTIAIENINFYSELEDIVEQRTAALERANQELESFSYTVSHDLRAPLRHINGFVEMLYREADNALSEKARHYMDVISKSAKRMGTLIDDLLSFSRMGKSEFSIRKIDMNIIINEVLKDFTMELSQKYIIVKQESLPIVQGDQAMLRVVLNNLLSNAIKFSAKSDTPEIKIGHNSINKEEVFFVKDNGAGFDMRFADKLFGVFQRLHSESEFEGTGIGLATVKRIINRHGGKVWAEGKPGEGACFYFSLPSITFI